MESAERRPRKRDYLAFVLPAAGFCLFDCLAPIWLGRTDAAPIVSATVGAFAGQLLWGAAWCALGPDRWIKRFLGVIATGVLLGGATIAGVYLQSQGPPSEVHTYYENGMRVDPVEVARDTVVLQCVSVLPLMLWIAQLPTLSLRAFRGWRIVFRNAEIPTKRPDPRNFGIADLLAITAGVAIVLGFWRLNFLTGSYDSLDALRLITFCVIAGLISGLLVLPIVTFALGDHPPRLAFAYTCAYTFGLTVASSLMLSLTNDRSEGLDEVLGVIAICLAAAAMTMHVSFWIARDVGYRFVRLRLK